MAVGGGWRERNATLLRYSVAPATLGTPLATWRGMFTLTPPDPSTIISASAIRYYGGDPHRVTFLRDVARTLEAGQVVLYVGREDGTLVLYSRWSAAPYAERRAASVAALAAAV